MNGRVGIRGGIPRAMAAPHWRFLPVILTIWGCASTSPAPAFQDVARTTRERSGHGIRWDQSTTEDKEAAKAIEALLERDLTADAAVQVALLGSPRLRATFEELSIAQADL